MAVENGRRVLVLIVGGVVMARLDPRKVEHVLRCYVAGADPIEDAKH
jgi:hypothetical protein